MRYKTLIRRIYYEPAHELAMADLVWRQRTPAVYWTSLTLHKRHDLAYIGQRRRCRGFGRCAGACWAMSVANRNRSSMRKCERPADVRTNGSGGGSRQVSKPAPVITKADAVFSPSEVLVYETELTSVEGGGRHA